MPLSSGKENEEKLKIIVDDLHIAENEDIIVAEAVFQNKPY